MSDETRSTPNANAERRTDDSDATDRTLPITRRSYLGLAAAAGAITSTDTVEAATAPEGAATDAISPYYNLAPDPTSESRIYWIDERDGADGSDQTFEFGTDPNQLDQQATATGTEVPEKNGIYRYYVDLSGLTAGTTYYGEIVADGTALDAVEWNTLPAALPDDGLDIVVYSDIHIDNSDGINDPNDMTPIREENPDLILFVGDYITWGDGSTDNRSDEEVVDWWLDLFRHWYGTLHENRLHPVLPVPGNHEVGNHSWDGTGTVNPDQGVFQFFYGYPKYLDPVGENYGEVTIGDYLQVLGLDTHSAYPEDVGNWLADAINENVTWTIPFHHSPLLTGGNRREPEDDDLQELLRDEWLRLLWDDGSVACHFAGHIHLREYTVPYEIVDEEPTSGDYIALDNGADGYLVEDDDADADRVRQFGTGYRANRSYDNEWFTDYITEEHQFYSLTVTSSELEVRELDASGNVYESHVFEPEGEEALSVVTNEATDVSESAATLNGSLDDLGGADSADVYFEWGPNGDLSNATDPQTLSSTGTFSAELTGLEAGTEYEYRAVAEASDGDTDTGSSRTFTTTVAGLAVIEDFEQYDSDTTLADVYSSDTGAFEVVSDTVFEGTQALYSADNAGQFINSTSGLDTYPEIGDTIEWYTWSESNSGDRLHICTQSETNRNQHYSIDHSLRDDHMRVGVYIEDEDGSGYIREYFAADTDFTTTRDERWLRHRLETTDTGSAHAFTYEIYEYNPSGDDTLLNSVSGSDDEASISDGQEYSTGGIGWLVYGNSSAERWFDGLAKVDDDGEGTVSVITEEATDITTNSAILHGELTELEGYDEATVYFEWGPSGDLSNETAPQTLTQNLSSNYTFSEELTDLSTSTEYEYRAVAETEDDTDRGVIRSFTTKSDDDAGIMAPTIDEVALRDTSNRTWARIEVSWAVSDEDEDLDEVTTVLNNGADSETSNVSDTSASGTHDLRERNGHGEATVTITVSDTDGNQTNETKTIELTDNRPGQQRQRG